MTKRTILFLAANPRGTDPGGLDPQARRVALDQEASAIWRELKRSGHQDRFELVTRWASEPQDLLRELRELKPTVVHFSGHGGREGLLFQAPSGDARVVSSAAIAETFEAAGASVQLVVLSTCYSEASAEALLAHVNCVIGMSGVLHDDMARAFAIGFYGALGDRESVEAAYRHGNAAISLEGLTGADRPQLKVRAGADAARIVLVGMDDRRTPRTGEVDRQEVRDGGTGVDGRDARRRSTGRTAEGELILVGHGWSSNWRPEDEDAPDQHRRSLTEQLDDAIDARDRQRERKQTEYAKQRTLVEEFITGATAALDLAAKAINRRAHHLNLDSPATVDAKCNFEGNDSMSAIIKMSMTRPRRDRERYFPDRGASVFYNWELYTSVHIEHDFRAEHSFTISALRDGWQDGWGCDIPTPECNPAGLSLMSAGEDIARRFMNWFTRYVA